MMQVAVRTGHALSGSEHMGRRRRIGAAGAIAVIGCTVAALVSNAAVERADWTRGGACTPAWLGSDMIGWIIDPICRGRTMVFAAGTGAENGQTKRVTGFRVYPGGRRAVADWRSNFNTSPDIPLLRLIDRVRFATSDGGRHWRPVRATETQIVTDYIPGDPNHNTATTTTGPEALSLEGCVWRNWTVTRHRAGPGKNWPKPGRVYGNVCVPRRVAQVSG